MKKPRPEAALLLFATSLATTCLAGCSCFEEQFHFRATEGNATNYFRVTISGWTALSTADYGAGLYPEAAVDALFGEVKGGVASPSSSSVAAAPQEGEVGHRTSIESFMGESVAGQRLVIMLTADPKAITDQIVAFTSSQDTVDAFVGLQLKEDRKDLAVAREDAAEANVRAKNLAGTLRSQAEVVEKVTTTDALEKALLEAARTLIAASRAPEGLAVVKTPSTLARDADTWRDQHPRAFRTEE